MLLLMFATKIESQTTQDKVDRHVHCCGGDVYAVYIGPHYYKTVEVLCEACSLHSYDRLERCTVLGA